MRWLVPRSRAGWVALALVLGLAAIAMLLGRGIADERPWTGWALGAAVLLLSCYGLKRPLASLALVRAATSYGLHLAVGYASLAVFLLHIRFRWPDGVFETVLGLAYAATALSGIVGHAIVRRWPRRLAHRGEEVILERIPHLRWRLREQAEAVVLAAVDAGAGDVVAPLHEAHVQPFLSIHQDRWNHLLGRPTRAGALEAELDTLSARVSRAEAPWLEELRTLVRRKADLDFHAAGQGLLRGWLLVHVPLAAVLVVLSVAHVLLVHAFGAGR